VGWQSLVAAAASTGADRLPPPTRAAAMMALLGIALVGMMLVVLILLGGHWVRRQGDFRRTRIVPPDRAPLVRTAAAPPVGPAPSDRGAGHEGRDTVAGDSAEPGETVVS
jgi:hypothetical protein